MARDKLITIRIEGDKRQAFGDLAKSQNTDTASLLYDFISGCLDGRIDISLVTGKGNRLDKLDNRIDSERIDKLETDTQRIDNQLDTISKKLTDWIEAFDDRLNDCDQGLTNRMISLEHRLNTLAIQLDSQQIDRIDTDSQKDRQGENPDMGTVATVETADTVEAVDEDEPGTDAIASIDGTVESVEPISTIETVASAIEDSEKKIVDSLDTLIVSPIETVESGSESISSINEPDTDAIGPVRGEGDSISEPCKGMNAAQAYRYLTTKGVKVSEKTLSNWANKIKHIPMTDKGDDVSEHLILRHGLYYPNPDQP